MKDAINELLNKIFGGSKKITERQPLRRSEKDSLFYAQWSLMDRCRELVNLIHKSYHFKKAGMPAPLEIRLYEGAGSNGFAIISGSKHMDTNEMTYLFEHFGTVVKRMGYRMAHSDREMTDRQHYVEIRERQYLKPPLSLDQPIDQLFGNVLMELVYADKEPQYLKLMVNTYAGRPYAEAKPFDDFMEKLFE